MSDSHEFDVRGRRSVSSGEYNVPESIARSYPQPDLETWMFLYSAARTARWVRMSHDFLANLDLTDAKIADYHFYAGVSAVLTATESLSHWLNRVLGINLMDRHEVTLRRERFRRCVSERFIQLALVDGAQVLEELGALVDDVVELRNRWQHREGFLLQAYQGAAGTQGWFLPNGPSNVPKLPGADISLLLEAWDRTLDACIDRLAVTLQAPIGSNVASSTGSLSF